MKIPFRSRTISNPLDGIRFTSEETQRIIEISKTLLALPDTNMRLIIREALARQIVWLDGLSDWTIGDMETERVKSLEEALMMYKATFFMIVAKDQPTKG